MTTEDYAELRAQLILHEGIRLKPYRDTVGKLTIGVGRNLTDRGISQGEAMELLENDIAACVGALNHALPWFPTLDPMRQRVLIDLCFNLGRDGLLLFHRMLEAIRVADYSLAAKELRASKWAHQVQASRVLRLTKMLETGKPA